MKILITGATGLLGPRMAEAFRLRGWDIVTHGFSKPADVNFDLCDKNQAILNLEKIHPDVIVNLVCLSDVEACEENVDRAYRRNVRPVEMLVTGMKCLGLTCRLIQISTDQLYDSPNASREDAFVFRNNYAFSKYAAELIAMNYKNSLIFRTNFFGRSKTSNRISFTDWLFNAFENESPIILFEDVMFSPLSMLTLSHYIANAITSNKTGVYNLGSRNGMSKKDFALALAKEFGLSTINAKVGTQQDVCFSARRPEGMIMDCSRFEQDFCTILPELHKEICLAKD